MGARSSRARQYVNRPAILKGDRTTHSIPAIVLFGHRYARDNDGQQR